MTPGTPASLGNAAREILRRSGAGLPDLSKLTVLVPNLHARSTLARALRDAAGRALLLPNITTFSALAAGGHPEMVTPSRRELQLYLALKDRQWFAPGDLWAVVGELGRLFDELTRHLVRLPESLDDFARLLEQAYRARGGRSLMFEAALVHELWHAMEREGVSPAAAYHLRLMRFAREASSPLYLVGIQDLTPAEEQFLERYAENAPVFRILETPAGDPVAALFDSAWQEGHEPSLAERAAAFRQSCDASPIPHFSLFAAQSLEQEAEGAQFAIRQWLVEGCERIAVVVQDRLSARRARALLERARILVSDETGWVFSTTSASTVVMRFLDAVNSRFYHEDLLDLLKSPFAFADLPESEKKQAIFRLEQWIREKNVVSGIDHYLKLAGGREPACSMLLTRLQSAARLMQGRARSLAEWIAALQAALEQIGVASGLRLDSAGIQLLDALAALERELSGETAKLSFGEWRRWLDGRFESMTFTDATIESQVAFTHLGATALRQFDAVLILGADAAHLPGKGQGGLFFNQSVRSELGLPTEREQQSEMRRELAALLCGAKRIIVSWQSAKNGEPNLLSPFFERLQAFHLHAWQDDLLDRDFGGRVLQNRIQVAESFPESPQAAPAPVLPGEFVPKSISASGYNSLLACPYQYYARNVLGLNQLDEVSEKLERADFGSYVHQILQQFHSENPRVSLLDREQAQATLVSISDAVFARAIEADYLSHAWCIRWKACIAGYLDWQYAWEQQGWRVHEQEAPRRHELALADGGVLTLKGRIDRIDKNGENHTVIDYKTQSASQLRTKLAEPLEEMQLPVYLLLAQLPASQAFFLSLGKGQSVAVSANQIEPAAWRGLAVERLIAIFNGLNSKAALPAQGIEAVCGYCEMRGLCRKDYWNA